MRLLPWLALALVACAVSLDACPAARAARARARDARREAKRAQRVRLAAAHAAELAQRHPQPATTTIAWGRSKYTPLRL